jgi:hypothetical protein
MIIDPAKMSIGDFKKNMAYTKEAEEILLNLVAKTLELPFKGLTQGNDSRYDGIVGDYKIEIKMTGANIERGDNRFCIPIEYRRKNGTPSGIMKTEADFWLTCSPGWDDRYKDYFGKLRFWNVKKLRNHCWNSIKTELDEQFGKNDNDGGSMVILAFPKKLDYMQTYMGEVAAIQVRKNYFTYDLSKII